MAYGRLASCYPLAPEESLSCCHVDAPGAGETMRLFSRARVIGGKFRICTALCTVVTRRKTMPYPVNTGVSPGVVATTSLKGGPPDILAVKPADAGFNKDVGETTCPCTRCLEALPDPANPAWICEGGEPLSLT